MNADSGTITMKCGKFKLEATEGIDMDSSARFGLSGGTVKVEASSMLKLESSGMASVAGSPVKIG